MNLIDESYFLMHNTLVVFSVRPAVTNHQNYGFPLIRWERFSLAGPENVGALGMVPAGERHGFKDFHPLKEHLRCT